MSGENYAYDWSQQRVLITGGTGTLGKALIPHLYSLGCTQIAILSRDEKKQHEMKKLYPRVHYSLACVRDRGRVHDVCYEVRPSLIIHAAALKQVQSCEYNPEECIDTNVRGTHNITGIARNQQAKLLLVSTDKAVYPVNTYGVSKALAEKIVLKYPFGSVIRYGNIMNSRGSVIENWIEAVKRRDYLTASPHTRWWLRIEQACEAITNFVELRRNQAIAFPTMLAASTKSLRQCFIEAYSRCYPCSNNTTKLENSFQNIDGDRMEKEHESIITQEEARYLFRKDYGINFVSPISPGHVDESKTYFNTKVADQWKMMQLTEVLEKIIQNTNKC